VTLHLSQRMFTDPRQLFSALYSMLPSAKNYLRSGGFAPQPAAYLLIGLFLGGVLGIQIISRGLHHFIPTHIVDCDHTHGEEEVEDCALLEDQAQEHEPVPALDQPIPNLKVTRYSNDEETPLLSRDTSVSPPKRRHLSGPEDTEARQSGNGFVAAPPSRRQTLVPRSLTRTFTKIASHKVECDETGPCKGFSDPCGQDCFKAVTRRHSGLPNSAPSRQTTFPRTQTTFSNLNYGPAVPGGHDDEETTALSRSKIDENGRPSFQRTRSATHHYHHAVSDHVDPVKHNSHRHASNTSSCSDPRLEHHHHVPTNAFLSIGLQTSIAIALHKAPEGFITYATNHANPTLGFAVFMALFIHNITEGFAMALPLYLALQSRTKAIIWSSFLGGVSQPLGAGIAAVWFKVAQGSDGVGKPSEAVYGCMFAITAGVMASVALQLFSESLGLTHNKSVCIGFAFLGMGILGVSSALTA
jgi:zinc transporter, ZIP family